MGNASSELQHFANTLSGTAPQERKFLKAVVEGNIMSVKMSIEDNPNVIYARTKASECQGLHREISHESYLIQ